MDRPIEPSQLRRTRTKRIVVAGIAVVGLTVAYVMLASWISPSVSRSDLRLAKVEVGTVDATLEAAGTVVPLEERLVTSPGDARVLRVLHRAGDSVRAGEPILELDPSGLKLEWSKLEQQLALQRNLQRRARLEAQQRLNDLEAEKKRQGLAAAFARVKRDQAERLHMDGLVSQETLLAARLEVGQADATLEKLEKSLQNTAATSEAELDGIGLQVGILEREKELAAARVAQTNASSDTAGTVTFAISEPGAQVHAGEILARLSDLTAFRVRATLSDQHAARIETGMPARVRADGRTLLGHVATVLPSVENGAVALLIDLDAPDDAALRSNRRVDVEVVVDRRERALCVARGPAISGAGTQDIFVVHGDIAERREIEVGLVNMDTCEIKSGLSEGDTVVVSDMKRWQSVGALGLR